MSGIYKIKNLVNDKVYIGKTTNINVVAYCERHFKNAEDGAHPERYFYNAIRKYGRDKFKIDIIEDGNFTNEELNEKEKYYINNFKSNDSTIGYNMTEGGDGGFTCVSKEYYGQKMKAMWQNEDKRNQIMASHKKYFIEHPEIGEHRSKKYTGSGNPNCKITEQQIIEIFELLNVGWLAQHIEKRFGIDKDYIWELKTGKSWKYFDKSKYKNLDLFYRNNFSLNPYEIELILNKKIETGLSIRKLEKLISINHSLIGRVLFQHNKIEYLINLKKVNDNIVQLYRRI